MDVEDTYVNLVSGGIFEKISLPLFFFFFFLSVCVALPLQGLAAFGVYIAFFTPLPTDFLHSYLTTGE